MSGEESPSAKRRPSRIVIVDDHPLFRAALRHMLRGQSDLEVVAEAENGREAVEVCRRFEPVLVLMDVRMPEMDGLEATRQIKRQFPRIIVLMLTAFEDPNYLSKALKAGAAGYVLKHVDPPQLIDAVRKVLGGESPLDQGVATQLLLRLVEEVPTKATMPLTSGGPSLQGTRPALLESLTPREVTVLRLVARGQTNREVARNLSVAPTTVKNHVQSIIAKLEVSDRTQAAVRAVDLGLLTEE
jgi:DNA-binding NarL/FixJ family response regulator